MTVKKGLWWVNMLFASWHCNTTNGQNQTTSVASCLNTTLGQNVPNPMTLFWKPGWFSVYKLVQKICWEPSTKIKSGRVSDHVQKISAKERWAKYRSERDLRERVSQKMRQTWQGRKEKNTHKHRSKANPAMYSFLWALNSFMWMCSMATGLLLRSTFSDTLYFLTSLNASVEAETQTFYFYFYFSFINRVYSM